MTKKKEWITAEELGAKLEADPEWVAARDRRAEEHRKFWASIDAELEPLEKDLRAAGAPSRSAMNSQTKPPNVYKAIPVLLAHLSKNYRKEARLVITCTLKVPEAKAHWHELTRLYREERDEVVKGDLGCAISVCADANVLDEVIALVRDKAQGPTRGALLHALEKSKDPRALATIDEFADDPDLREEIKAIRKRAEQRKKRKLKKMH